MSSIKTRTIYIPPSDRDLPALALQVMSLMDSYMIWLGVTEEPPERVESAANSGSLCKDWACAMPSSPGSRVPGPATSLFRSTGSDVALSMGQRLATKFRKQIFLSVDIPSAYLSSPNGSRLLLDSEKRIVGVLRESESSIPQCS